MIFPLAIWGQIPDHCAEALPLRLGASPLLLTNEGATLTPTTQPAGRPTTCIESFENDLWFTFRTEAEYAWYAVRIEPVGCNTPAGLQALLIRADSCAPAGFVYVDCQNPQSESGLALFTRDETAGRPYLIHVDGYDGTQCTFTIAATGYATDPRELDDLRRQELDFARLAPEAERPLPMLDATFLNNEVELQWQTQSRAAVQFFQVLLYPEGQPMPGMVLATLDPQQTVGTELSLPYRFRHQAEFVEDQRLCYRVAWYSVTGQKYYSPPVCVIAKPVPDLYVGEVTSGPEKGIFRVHYISKRKQDLTFQVLNQEGQVQKEVTLKRVGLQDGDMEIDMRSFPPGNYDVRVIGKGGFFQRRFELE
ncbi:MAG: hypothetical protein D6722_15185 [Bacteroidetes bacterium]|nr:MAG: hypothetical protein D6722_15185 [Bacteroidota bacterium]